MNNIIRVRDIVNHMHKLANPGLAYDWDNVGLQLGDPEQEVKKILLTLDVTDNAIEKAISQKADLLISHHPFIFKPIKKITNPIYLKLIRNNIAVFCAHTNLDVISGGVNHALADLLGLSSVEFLSQESGSQLYHLAVHVPPMNMEEVAEAAFAAGAGKIGNYSNCITDYEVSGQFMPVEGANPTEGELNRLEKVVERKLEFFVDSFNLNKVVAAVKKAHPYETPAYAVYPQHKQSETYGLGLIGKIEPTTLHELAQAVKQKLGCPFVKVWPAHKGKEAKIKRVAICGGSGTSLLRQIPGRADVFISADFTYHTVLDSKVPLIDAGHFFTEFPVLKNLEKYLSTLELEIITLEKAEHEISKFEVI